MRLKVLIGLIKDLQEGFCGSDPQNPDTDGDGHLDGREVEISVKL